MKSSFTCLGVLCLLIAFFPGTAISQTSFQYNFSAPPTLISGTAKQVNAKYRFANVSAGIDAIVTISAATNGATVDIFDDNAITKPEGFSPKILVPGRTTGLVEFQICFVASGTLNTAIQDSLYATAIDIDGGAQLKEIDMINMGGGVSSFVAGNPEISVTQSGTLFTGRNVAGNEYDGIDTSAKKVMFTVKNSSVGCFTYTCGASNTANGSSSRQKSIYFKNFTYPPAALLPVSYLSFDAVAQEKAVHLKWVTASEQNHSHFEVERSFDKAKFNTIAVVLDGMQAEAGKKVYLHKDLKAFESKQKIVYYRLKQFDLDGKANLSAVIAVRLSGDAGATMEIAPNPFTSSILASYESDKAGKASLQLYDVQGRLRLAIPQVLSKGMNSFRVEGLASLPPAMYFTKLIVDGNVVATNKIVKQ